MKTVMLFVLCASVLFTSCKKESLSPTQGQLMAASMEAELGVKSDVEQPYTTHVFDEATGNSLFNGTSLSISNNGFIVLFNNTGGTITRVTYNLEVLKSYEVLGHSLYLYY